jgi:lysophospholipase L1-like esterase
MNYLLIGDSHCHFIGMRKPEWTQCAFPGITSGRFNLEHPGPFSADVIVVSLGGNDERFPHPPSNTTEELLLLRTKLSAKKVIWFVTRNSDKVRELQTKIANQYGDLIIDSRNFEVDPDDVHLSHNGYINVITEIERENAQ